MTTVAEADIRIGLSDAEAIAGLRAVDREVDRTMRNIDGKEAEVQITGNVKRLKKALAEGEKEIQASEERTAKLKERYEETDSRGHKSAITKKMKSEEALRRTLEDQNKTLGKRIGLQQDELDLVKQINTATGIQAGRQKTIEAGTRRQTKATQDHEKAEQALGRTQARAHRENEKYDQDRVDRLQAFGRLQARAAAEDERRSGKREADQRTWIKMQSDAEVLDRKITRERITGAAREEAQVARLQARYRKLEEQRQRIDRRTTKLHTLADPQARQKVDIDRHDTLVEMEALRAELAAMGHEPITQRIDLDTDRANNALSRWLKGINDTAVRVGPVTTSIAGLGRALLLLGPVISGVVGQIGALVAVTGSGLLGAVGAGAAALAGFGLSLGGVGLLIPSLLRDFKNLNTLQKAYHVQVLKTGANSDKAKNKLKEFQHALGAVGEPARRAFTTLGTLQDKWRAFSKDPDIRANFYKDLGTGLETVNHHFDWFKRNTTAAFDAVSKGWTDWNKRLRSPGADKVLSTLGRNANRSIGPLMHALGNLGAAFGRIAASFSKWLPGLMKGFDDWTGSIARATEDGTRLDGITKRMVGSMKDLGHFAMAAGNFLAALFAPGVDPGRNMLQGWTRGLNDTARSMRTVKREEIHKFFVDAIDTANRFWTALKPLVQIFFEWSTIMQPFTKIALDFFGILGKGLQTVLDFGPTKGIFQAAFVVFLTSQVLQRARGIGTAIWSIAKGIGAVKAAGGLGAALKGGISRMFNPLHGVRGATPATPMFVKDVGLPGKLPGGGVPGGPVGRAPGGPAGPGMLGTLGNLSKFAKIGGGIAIAATATIALTKAIESSQQKKASAKLSKDLQEMVSTRNISGLRMITTEMDKFGGGLDKLRQPARDALKAVERLEAGIATSSISKNFANIQRNGAASMTAIRNTVRTNMQTIRSRMDTNSDEGRKAIQQNFKLAAEAVRRRMHETGRVTKEGMALVKQYAVAGMKAMGLTDAQANAKFKTGTLKNSDDRPGAATIPGIHKERGGLMQVGRKGQRGPDSVPMNLGGVPAVVAPGEQIAVFNSQQQRRFAQTVPGGLEGFFAGPQPRHGYQDGGIVALGRALQAQGFSVSENPAFGGVSPVHAPNSYHYRGMAIDVNADNMPGGEKANLDRLYARLRTMPGIVELLWQVAGHFDHLHVAMGGAGAINALGLGVTAPTIDGVTTNVPGVPGVAANRALAVAREAGQSVVDAVASTMAAEGLEAGVGQPGAGAASRGQMVAWARQALSSTQPATGWGPTAANIASLLTLAMKESSWIVDSINNWDSNAKAGNPSGGLMHVTLDKVGGSMARLFDPVANMAASIMYQFKQYGRLVTMSPYEQGGLVGTMPSGEWARGGKIEKPTLLTGEDGRTHPEFVVGTNPQFKKSNVSALQSAARALGIPMARESKEPLKGFKGRNAGKEVESLPYVKKYARLQAEEDDKQREISIAQSRIHEPDTLIKETGKDANGEPIYDVDQKAIDNYKKQMEVVTRLYGDLVGGPSKGRGNKSGWGGIMGALLAAGHEAMDKLAKYRFDRDQNITRIREAIARDEGLLKSKDKDVRKQAQKRLVHNREIVGEQVQKKQDAGQKRDDIRTDVHDANFRAQEYAISRDDVLRDIGAVAGRAAEDAASQNPDAGADTGPDPLDTRSAALDAELALERIGQGINGQPPRPEQDILKDQAGVYQAQINKGQDMLRDADPTNDMDAYSLISSAASALQGIQGELAKYDPMVNAKLLADATRSATTEFGSNFIKAAGGGFMATTLGQRAVQAPYRTGSAPRMGGAAVGGMGGAVTVNLKPTFANVPPDPHTWSKGVAFELQAAL